MDSRQSRMNKYYVQDEEVSNIPSRTKKNQELYKKVSDLDLEEFDLNSNISVIGDNTDNINLDEIKNILSKKYHENPRNKSFGASEDVELPKIRLDETREYDINSILEKAKEQKEIDYEEDRLKKLRNTQYDILKGLDNVDEDEEDEEKVEVEAKKELIPENSEAKKEKELLDLIDTITAKELIKNEENLSVTGEMDPLDILSDLRGEDESTKVMGMLAKEIADIEEQEQKEQTISDTTTDIKTKKISSDTDEVSITQIISDESDNTAELNNTNTFTSTNTFTKSNKFNFKDFEDFEDIKKDMSFVKIIIRIFVIIIVLLIIAGIIILLNKYLNLGLF